MKGAIVNGLPSAPPGWLALYFSSELVLFGFWGAGGGLVDIGQSVFYAMEIEPEKDHLICMVHLLAGGRRFKEAKEFIQGSPAEHRDSLWLTFLVASAGRWEYVQKLRKRLKGRGMKKEPGCSWLQVGDNNEVSSCNSCLHLKTSYGENHAAGKQLNMASTDICCTSICSAPEGRPFAFGKHRVVNQNPERGLHRKVVNVEMDGWWIWLRERV
uniref:Pentatricopeptide repeat-containing protein n=1 Tax=Nelumbo nucifera TaxID=4432 RepID=A0A822ZFE5_NELNU|nr:TPA_asm: hypothetical protein HUJ06_000399 [Nelumbo nucifera]